MTYSTGSGNYVALMAAVLAHAVADGWTTTAGNWPINKGVVRGVDWSTFTASEVDRTFLGGASKTARYVNISIGTSPASATANAAATATSAVAANMEYTFTSWHIFSDPALCDYIHVVYNFSNGVNGDCYGHFSFGELDLQGMTHTGIAYATASPNQGYSVNNSFGNQGNTSNGGMYGQLLHAFSGTTRYTYTQVYNYNNLVYIIDPTVSPLPGAGWPTVNTLNGRGDVMDTISQGYSAISFITPANRTNMVTRWATWCQLALPQPYSGAISMTSLPFFIIQGLLTTSQMMYVGAFPNVRMCGMEGYNPQDIVTYSTDDWMIFPMLRSTPWTQMMILDTVSSGRSGYAYKKVP